MLTVEEILSRAATPQAPPQAPPPLPPPYTQPIYYVPAPQPKPRTNWFAYILIGVLLAFALFSSAGFVQITDLSQAPKLAAATPAPGINSLPTAQIVLRSSTGAVVTPVQAQSPPLAQQVVPTAIPAQAPAQAEPTALPVSDIEIPVPATTNSDVQPTAEAVVPQYQYDPNGPDPMPAKTTGEYEGWGGGAGAGWVIPTPKPLSQTEAKPVVSSTRNRDETVAQTTGDYAGWGGGSGQGWEIPAADNNNGWSLGN